VFIPGLYQGSIPHSRAEDTDEERRLLYVAMTRAQGLLYISYPTKGSSGGTIIIIACQLQIITGCRCLSRNQQWGNYSPHEGDRLM
jgi:superfamily I DNA/RNA helicase